MQRGILGILIGLVINYLITIGISLGWAKGYYVPCTPELEAVMGNEINAVVLQALLSGLLGIGFGAGTVVWEIEHWSIVKQTGVYFIVTSVFMMPIAYFTYWMEHSVVGFLSYFGVFVVYFCFIWIVLYMVRKSNVKKMNDGLCRVKEGEGP